MEILIREARIEDAANLVMREADAAEVRAMGSEPYDALHESITHSIKAWTAECEEGIICVWGYCPCVDVEHTCTVWLLGSDLVKRITRTFLEESKARVAEMLQDCEQLYNLVMQDNVISRRWLKWLGAEFHGTCMIDGVAFEPFTIGRSCVNYS